MAYHTVKNLSYFNVSLVIHGDNFTAWAVLSLIVGNFTYVLWELVDCQAWTCVDGLTLHRAAGLEDVCGPLILVIWTCSKESQVV